MKKRHGFIAAAVAVSLLAAQTFAGAYYTQDLTFPLQSSDNETVTGDYYVKSTLDNISWGNSFFLMDPSKCVIYTVKLTY